MLEEVKKALISQKEEELSQKKRIENAIQELNLKESKENFNMIDRKLTDLKNQIDSLNHGFMSRMKNGRKIQELSDEYMKEASNKMEVLKQYNEKRNKLLNELHDKVYAEPALEQEINKIQDAKSLEDLQLTEEEALKIIRKHNEEANLTTIQKIFSEVLLTKPRTREEIFTIMQNLYRVNSSPFVTEMREITLQDFVNQLFEIDIEIEKDKLVFINDLVEYIKSGSKTTLPDMQELEKTDRLDSYYCNQVEAVLANISHYPNPNSIAVPQVMALTAIISIAKQNKKEMLKRK